MSPASILKWLTLLLLTLGILGLVGYAIMMSRQAAPAAEKVNTQTVVKEISGLGRLELAHYRLSVTATHEVDLPLQLGMIYIPRKSKVLVMALGEAIGCIDLAKLDSNAITIADSVLRIKLPPPEVCIHRIDLSKSQVFSSEYSVLLFDDNIKAGIVKKAFANAEEEVLKAALSQGILAETDRQADVMLRPLLMKLGFRRIELTHPHPAADR